MRRRASPELVTAFIAQAQAAPDELSTMAMVLPAMPMPFVPAEYHGQLIVMALICYAGDAEAGERAIAPFRGLATPIVDMVGPKPDSELFPPDEVDYRPIAAGRTLFMDDVDRDTAGTVLERLRASDAPMRVVQLRVLGGAAARVHADDTAYAHRQSRIMVNIAAFYEAPAELPARQAWVDNLAATLRQQDTGAYVNFLGDEGETGLRAAYPGTTLDRLREVKRRYDPTNLFRLNHNIQPANSGS